MIDDEDARRLRAEIRRTTWTFERLTPAQFERSQPFVGGTAAEHLERLEQLRQLAFGLAGIDYPEGPASTHERTQWPVERIG